MSPRPRSVAGIAVAAVIGAGALFVLPAAGFASDAADAAEATEFVRHRHDRLTDEQRDCLAEQGITRPDSRPSAEERQALREQMREAAEACDIERPEPLLSDEQRACLDEQGISRPDGRPSMAERRAFREQLRGAAEECGIELPLRSGRGHGPGCWRDGESDPSESTTNAAVPAA